MSDPSEAAAIVTGAASGIGAALVTRLRAGGADVLAVDVQAEPLERLAAETGCRPHVADVTSQAANEAMAEAAVDAFGRLDLAFLNAGVLGRGRDDQAEAYRVGELDLDQYRRVMPVNTDAVIFGTVAVAAAIEPGGGIVVTASAAGVVPWPPTPFYTASKHAVVGWVRATAGALAEQQVTINAICPGGVATALLGLTAEDAAGSARLLDPDVVAEAAIATATGDATGTAVTVVAGRDPVVQTHEFAPIPGFP